MAVNLTLPEYAIQLAFHYLDKPYIYGGNDPLKGSDCSGFVCYILQATGRIRQGVDYNAAELLVEFPESLEPKCGNLVFYGRTSIQHVMLCINQYICIGATGGDKTTVNLEQAYRKNARIRVMPITYRKDLNCYVNPFYLVG